MADLLGVQDKQENLFTCLCILFHFYFQYALKVIDLRSPQQVSRTQVMKEADILRSLNHPHVLTCFAVFEYMGALCLVTDYCMNGDLSTLLCNRKQNLTHQENRIPEAIIIEWFGQIASALQYIHGKKILHRDVKSANILLTDDLKTKLGDFGLAHVLESPEYKATSFIGSPYYMSPEILSGNPYDEKSDVWSLGVVIYELATLRLPFETRWLHELDTKILTYSPAMPAGYSREFINVLSRMLNKERGQRPSAKEILLHDLFKVTQQMTMREKQFILNPTKMLQVPGHQSYYEPFDIRKILNELDLHLCKDNENQYTCTNEGCNYKSNKESTFKDHQRSCQFRKGFYLNRDNAWSSSHKHSLRVPSSHTVLNETGRLCRGCEDGEYSVKQTNVTKHTDIFKQKYADDADDDSEMSTVCKNLENMKPSKIQKQAAVGREFEILVEGEIKKIRDVKNTKITRTVDTTAEKHCKDRKDNEEGASSQLKKISVNTKGRLTFVYETIENQVGNHESSLPTVNTRNATSVRTLFKKKDKDLDIDAQTELSRRNKLAFLDKMRQMRK